MADEAKPDSPPKPAAEKPPAKPKAPAVMAVEAWEGELPGAVREQFGEAVLEASTYLGQSFFVVKPDIAIPLIEHLRFEMDFDYLVDVTATDDPAKPERFEVVYILYSFARNERIRIKARVKEGDQARRRRCRSTSRRTGWSARCLTCSGSSLKATRT
jgi:NADH-quinone oxidoreductase subunit C